MSNLNKDLLALVDCDRFLISTNGDKYGHPDQQTVELLGRHRVRPSAVYFNYSSKTTSRWHSPDEQQAANITAHYPDTGSGIAVTFR